MECIIKFKPDSKDNINKFNDKFNDNEDFIDLFSKFIGIDK